MEGKRKKQKYFYSINFRTNLCSNKLRNFIILQALFLSMALKN